MPTSADHEWPYSAWELRKRDGYVLVARLYACEPDFPFFVCQFEPTPAFAEYRPLFDKDLALAEKTETEWERLDEIWAILNRELVLIPGRGGKGVADFLLHIDAVEGRGWFRVIFEGES